MNDPVPDPRFFCYVIDKKVGPLDLIELAAELNYKKIDGETPICREGEEEWRVFREWPEFVAAQEIPIEVIARHLEAKERAGDSGKAAWPVKSYSWTLAVYAGLVLMLTAAIAVFFSQGTHVDAKAAVPAPAVAVEPVWVKTNGDHFSIVCPVALDSSSFRGAVRYEGHVEGAAFEVVVESLQNFDSLSVNDEVMQKIRKGVEDKFSFTTISEHAVKGVGFYGTDVSYTHLFGTVMESGRVRYLAGAGQTFVVLLVARPEKFSSEDMDRFMNSFEVR